MRAADLIENHFPRAADAAPLWRALRAIIIYSYSKMREYRAGISSSISLKILSFPLGLALIYLTRAALDRGIFARDLSAFFTLTLLGLAAFLASQALGYFSEKAKQKVKSLFSAEVNRDFSGHLFNMDYLRIKRLSSAENSFILDYDHGNVEDIIFGKIPSLASLLKVPVFFVLAFMLSAPLTLLLFLALPFMAVNFLWASKGRNRRHKENMRRDQEHRARLNDILLNIKLIKSFGRENWALDRVMRLFIRKKEAFFDMHRFGGKVYFAGSAIMRASTALFWLAGGYLIIKGDLSFGSFTAVSMYAALVLAEIDNAGYALQDLYAERFSIERCAGFIKEFTVDEKVPPVNSGVRAAPRDGIEFRNVAFSYAEERPLFGGLSLTIPRGKWTLIKGVSGAGKTTLLCLALRLLKPVSGEILLDGKDISVIDKEKFHGEIAVVHQEPYILNDSLRENITLGRDALDSEIDRAMYLAGAGELVEGLSLGYNTFLGESGQSVSGGQRQRVAIARALARRPGILLLDEATSFLDGEKEAEIFSRIKKEFPDLTVVFVTHRETGSGFADRVLVLEGGLILDEADARVT